MTVNGIRIIHPLNERLELYDAFRMLNSVADFLRSNNFSAKEGILARGNFYHSNGRRINSVINFPDFIEKGMVHVHNSSRFAEIYVNPYRSVQYESKLKVIDEFSQNIGKIDEPKYRLDIEVEKIQPSCFNVTDYNLCCRMNDNILKILRKETLEKEPFKNPFDYDIPQLEEVKK